MAKTVLITGSSSGIGKATARHFQQQGWQVAASMRSPDKETELTKLERVFCPVLDVTKPGTIQQALEETETRFGGIDVLVNNAGYGLVGPFELATREQVKRQFDTNVLGVMETIRAILPRFRAQGHGAIVNVSSVSGVLTFPMFSLYHGTKWGIEGFSESLQFELRPFNIRVKLVEPGPIKTRFYAHSLDMTSNPDITDYDAMIAQFQSDTAHSINRMSSTPEVAAKGIYRAATDNGWKLRYPMGGHAGSLIFLRKILPNALFRAGIRLMTFRGHS